MVLIDPFNLIQPVQRFFSIQAPFVFWKVNFDVWLTFWFLFEELANAQNLALVLAQALAIFLSQVGQMGY